MSRSTLAIPLSLTVLAACVWLLSQGDAVRPRTGATQEVKTAPGELLVFCAASNRSVVEAIRKRYEAETGRSVQFQYGPSQALLSQLELTRAGDLFLPADDSYLDLAQQKGFTAEVLPLGRMRCGLVVPKGNPHGIDEISDLFSEALRVVQASPESTAVGRLAREALLPLGLWEPLNAATDAYRTTVGDVANDVRVGAADVGIVFDVVLYPFPDLEFIASSWPRHLLLFLYPNPMAQLVGIFQGLILNQHTPVLNQMLFPAVVAVGCLLVGASVFAHNRRHFADLV